MKKIALGFLGGLLVGAGGLFLGAAPKEERLTPPRQMLVVYNGSRIVREETITGAVEFGYNKLTFQYYGSEEPETVLLGPGDCASAIWGSPPWQVTRDIQLATLPKGKIQPLDNGPPDLTPVE